MSPQTNFQLHPVCSCTCGAVLVRARLCARASMHMFTRQHAYRHSTSPKSQPKDIYNLKLHSLPIFSSVPCACARLGLSWCEHARTRNTTSLVRPPARVLSLDMPQIENQTLPFDDIDLPANFQLHQSPCAKVCQPYGMFEPTL